jgi:YidC/Oxa1 family membrane protein insertase
LPRKKTRMDKNSIIGLLLIGAIMIGFTIVNKPDREALEKEQAQLRQADSLKTLQNVGKSQKVTKFSSIAKHDSTLSDSLIDAELLINFGKFANATKGIDTIYKIETSKHIIHLSSKGGHIEQVELKDFKTWEKKELNLCIADSSKFNISVPSDNNLINTKDLHFNLLGFEGDNTSDSSTFILRSNISESEWIDFKYTAYKDSYKVGFIADFSNAKSLIRVDSKKLAVNWEMVGSRQEKNLDNERNNTTIYYRSSKENEVDKISPLEATKTTIEDPIEWLGFKEQFFANVLISKAGILPLSELETSIIVDSQESTKKMQANFEVPFSQSASGKLEFTLFLGPTQYALLKDTGHDLQLLVPLGWGIFGWVNKLIVIPAFNFLGQFNLGYGIVILLLTLYIKLILLIFQYKSYISQAKMRVLKPEIDELNKKYENGDAMEKQQATMTLYRQAGVNPMGGCLPMVFQIPVLFAMFSFFPASIELRQESFLWADDLSTYDSIVNLPFTIPFYGDHVSLFALLMTVSTILYTRMNNQLSSANTQMMPGLKWMMYLMPVIFLFVLNSYASGLNYYYFLANIITFGQQFMFRKLVDDDKIHAKIQNNKNKPKSSTKSTFQQKLEEMAKAKTVKAKK